MNKAQLVKVLYTSLNQQVSMPECEVALETVLTAITDVVATGEPVKIHSFGQFFLGGRKACTKTNPKNPSLIVDVPAKKVFKFKPYSAVREQVNS
jgi:nucleoid DNA-binding protein